MPRLRTRSRGLTERAIRIPTSDEPIPHIATLVERLQRVAGRAVPFDALCLAIWPDRPWQASVHSLRQLVHATRKTLPPDAISTTPGYGYAWTGKPPQGDGEAKPDLSDTEEEQGGEVMPPMPCSGK